jgi:hypothetical protein
MSTIAALLWDKIPAWVRWIVAVVFFLFYTPLKIREELIVFIDTRAMAVMSPAKDKTDNEIVTMKSDLSALKEDVRDVKNYLLYRKRPEDDKGINK